MNYYLVEFVVKLDQLDAHGWQIQGHTYRLIKADSFGEANLIADRWLARMTDVISMTVQEALE